jgi:hypothetical protein
MTYAPAPPGGWGYGYVPAGARPAVKHSSHSKLIAVFVVGLLIVVGGFLLIAKTATPAHKTAKCPPTCPQPPLGDPVVAMPRFAGPGGTFSVGYPKPDHVFGTAELQKSSVLVPVKVGDGGEILLQGGSSSGKTAEQAVTSFVRSRFPDASRAYAIPNPLVGYQPGYGEVDDIYLQSSDGTSVHERIVVLAAVKNGVAALAAGIGPYHEFAQDGLTNGHPSGAGVLVALVMDPLVNSFRWKGDPAR